MDDPSWPQVVDVAVVGGSAAGLSAALVLGRSRRSVLVLDDGRPRNERSAHVQGFLTRDGIEPAELTRLAEDEVRRYGTELVRARVARVRPGAAPDGGPLLEVSLDDGRTVTARRVLVATGLRDELPDIDGLQERWGWDVLHCPYCHGWEIRDQRLAVVVSRAADAARALTLAQWSARVTLVLHGLEPDELDERSRTRLQAMGVPVVSGPVTGLRVERDAVTGLRLADGSVLEADAVVVQPRLVANDDLVTSLGVETEDGPFGRFVVTDVSGATGVPGLWAAGNVTDPGTQVVMAAAAGYRAALAIDHDLIEEDVDRAVRRAAAG